MNQIKTWRSLISNTNLWLVVFCALTATFQIAPYARAISSDASDVYTKNNIFTYQEDDCIPTSSALSMSPPTSTAVGDTSGLPAETVSYLDGLDIPSKLSVMKPIYEYAEQQTKVPWQVLAAIHYRESGMRPGTSVFNGQPLGNYTNVDGIALSSDAKKDVVAAANHLIKMAAWAYQVNVAKPDSSAEELGKAFLSYNRGKMYVNWGMDWQKSPYVMNGYDIDHMNMVWTNADSWVSPGGRQVNSIAGKKDGNPVGALTMYKYLGGVNAGSSATGCSSSTGSSSAVAGNIVETAKSFAWDQPVARGVWRESEAKPTYPPAQKQYNKSTGTCEFSDCGVFVSTVMRASGVDTSFPARGTGIMMDYMRNSGKYLVDETPSLSEMQPGDILVVRYGGGGGGHIQIYTGQIGESGGRKLVAIDAALCSRVPSYRPTGDVQWTLNQGVAISARPLVSGGGGGGGGAGSF